MKKIQSIINRLNVAKHIAHHMIGEEHTHTHRRIVGAGIMIAGVSIVKLSLFTSSFFLHFLADLFGYALHGIGLIPFASSIERSEKQESPLQTTKTISENDQH